MIFNIKGLRIYIIVSYLDKLLFFLIPFSILILTKNNLLYNDVEYIFSIALLLSSLLEGGLRIYMFYYINVVKSSEINISDINVFYDFHLLIIVSLSIIIILIAYIYHYSILLISYIAIRSLILMLFNFYSYYYRIKNYAVKAFLFSIPLNLVCLLIIIIYKEQYNLYLLFLPQFIFLFIYLVIRIKKILKIDLIKYISYFKKSFFYSWPILINVVLVNLLSQYSKIYTYNFLSSSDMTLLSFILRLLVIIQLAHSSIIAYFSNDFYSFNKQGLIAKIFKKYSLFIFLASTFTIIIYIITLKLNLISNSNWFSFFLLLFYMIIWCFQSYYDLYFGKNNLNKIILIISVFAIAVMISFLILINQITLTMVIFSMLLGVSTNLLGKIIYLKKKNLIRLYA